MQTADCYLRPLQGHGVTGARGLDQIAAGLRNLYRGSRRVCTSLLATGVRMLNRELVGAASRSRRHRVE